MTNRQRLKPTYNALHPPLSVDQRGFIYLYGLKLCRYDAGRNVLEFKDPRRSQSQAQRFIEIAPVNLAQELTRLTEEVE